MKETILQKLDTATKPVIEIVQKSDAFKVIAIGLNPTTILKKHTAPGRSKILVIKGSIKYISERESITLNYLENYNIPLEEVHEVRTDENSIFLLIVG